MTTTTAQQLAADFYNAFTVGTRTPENGGGSYYHLRKGSPAWMQDLCREAHDNGNMFPDDWRYQHIAAIAEALAELDDWTDLHETLDSLVDIYSHDLTSWLSSHGMRPGYVDEAVRELGDPGSEEMRLQYGQYQELTEIAAALVEGLEARADDEVEEVAE